MKKVLPILFITSTALVTVAGLTLSSKGIFRQLKADDNSHTYTQTFTAEHISYFNKKFDSIEFQIKKKTAGGSDFGCEGNAIARVDIPKDRSNDYIAKGEYWDEYSYISMTFVFRHVLAPVSVVLNGEFYDEREYKSTSLTFTQVSTIDGYPAISFTTDNLTDLTLNSVVVQYTCSY